MYNGLKIAIIGYKNHALRLRESLIKNGVRKVVNYNHHLDDLSSIENSDAFFISSPNETHKFWVDKLDPFDRYIFCEKPPVTNRKDLKDLETYRPKLFFNFNYRFSALTKIIEKVNQENELGRIINIHCVSTHGLAYKSSFKDNWRFKSKNFFSSIVGNVGIHYIDLMCYLFGDIRSINMNYLSIKSKTLPDCCKLSMVFNNSFVDIFLSYSTVLQNKVEIFYENGILTLYNGVIKIQSPRDTFDERGYFLTPKAKVLKKFSSSKDYYDDSINESVKYFLNCVKSKSNISKKNYKQSILSNKIMLDLKNKPKI